MFFINKVQRFSNEHKQFWEGKHPAKALHSPDPMKKFIFILTVLASAFAQAQEKTLPTETCRIFGKVKQERTVSVAALDSFQQTSLGDLVVLNGKGEKRETAKNVKGILLKDLFTGIDFVYENRKALNRFFLVFTATDAFTLVLSWNEVFHTENCTNYYLLTERDGKKAKQLDERMEIVAVTQANTMHKRIEGLTTIAVNSVEQGSPTRSP